jgi:hypothetical protein
MPPKRNLDAARSSIQPSSTNARLGSEGKLPPQTNYLDNLDEHNRATAEWKEDQKTVSATIMSMINHHIGETRIPFGRWVRVPQPAPNLSGCYILLADDRHWADNEDKMTKVFGKLHEIYPDCKATPVNSFIATDPDDPTYHYRRVGAIHSLTSFFSEAAARNPAKTLNEIYRAWLECPLIFTKRPKHDKATAQTRDTTKLVNERCAE